MKALTLTAAWAWAVAHAGKDVENRKTRCPSILGHRIAIHAGAMPRTAAESSRQGRDFLWIWSLAGVLPGTGSMGPDYGAVVATALITGWSFVTYANARTGYTCAPSTGGQGCVSVSQMPYPGHPQGASRWFVGPVGWHMEEVRTLPTPVPARGRQGLWDLSEAEEAEVLAQAYGPCPACGGRDLRHRIEVTQEPHENRHWSLIRCACGHQRERV